VTRNPIPDRGVGGTIRVLIADDQPLVRAGFRMVLDGHPDIDLVGEATNGVEALDLVRHLDPDVVLMDTRMPELDGVQATRRLVGSGARCRILVLTTFDLDEYLQPAVQAGANGILLKDVRPADLVDAVRVVAAGNTLLAPMAMDRLMRYCAWPDPEAARTLVGLTERERETLRLLASGLSNAELARELCVSETTAKTHVSAVLRKLGVRDRVQAVIAAYDGGLITPGR
jgi:DNA-binding NarL/FixJ family response regulator